MLRGVICLGSKWHPFIPIRVVLLHIMPKILGEYSVILSILPCDSGWKAVD
jgi:hypothetical protein